MDFGTLKSRVSTILGRSPSDLAYEMVTSDVNNRIRVRSLQKTVRRHVTNDVSLPADIKSIKSAKISDVEITPIPFTSVAMATQGRPTNYAITEGIMHLAPQPGQSVLYEGEFLPARRGISLEYGVSAPDALRQAAYAAFGQFSQKPAGGLFRVYTIDDVTKSVYVSSTQDLGEKVYVSLLAISESDVCEVPFWQRGSAGDYFYRVEGGTAAANVNTRMKLAVTAAASGTPSYLLVSASETLTVRNQELELVYFERLADLSADSDTNDILTNYPQVYVYGTLFHHHALTQNAEAAQGYWTLFDRAMKEAERENNAAQFGHGPVTPKVRNTP